MPTANCQLPELPSYQSSSCQVTESPVIELPSYQVTSHQDGNYQRDELKHQKRREEDTCLIAVEGPELLVLFIIL